MTTNERLKDEQIKDILQNIKKGPKAHLISDCPLCNKEGHFYFNTLTQQWDCKKCGESGNVLSLLFKLGKTNLIRKFVDITNPLQQKIIHFIEDNKEEIEQKSNLKPIKLPIGFKYVNDHPYLRTRNFKQGDYQKYKVGKTALLTKLEDYVIFPVMENGDCYGYVARLGYEDKNKPKYLNSKTDFHLLLYGLDEIEFFVDTVILVEGILTKKACEERLGLKRTDPVRVCATFGKKISIQQILKLILKGVKNIILIFDEDARKEAQIYSQKIQEYFEQVFVGLVSGGDLDECSDEQFAFCFQNLMEPTEFKYNVLKSKSILL